MEIKGGKIVIKSAGEDGVMGTSDDIFSNKQIGKQHEGKGELHVQEKEVHGSQGCCNSGYGG